MTRCLQPPTGEAAQAAQMHRASLPRIETERLVLRAATLEDFPVWQGFFEAGDFEGNAETAWEEFCVYTAGWLLHGHGLLAIEVRDGLSCAGFVLLGLEWGDPEPELGWMLAPEARGKGYATEAAAALRQHAAAHLGLDRVVSFIDSHNSASQRVAERLGATLEGSYALDPQALLYRHRAQ